MATEWLVGPFIDSGDNTFRDGRTPFEWNIRVIPLCEHCRAFCSYHIARRANARQLGRQSTSANALS